MGDQQAQDLLVLDVAVLQSLAEARPAAAADRLEAQLREGAEVSGEQEGVEEPEEGVGGAVEAIVVGLAEGAQASKLRVCGRRKWAVHTPNFARQPAVCHAPPISSICKDRLV